MRAVKTDVQALQQPVQLPWIDLDDFTCAFGPGEDVLFKSLVPETESGSIPVKDLDHVSSAFAKNKHVPGEGV